jgi:hypothetical protein
VKDTDIDLTILGLAYLDDSCRNVNEALEKYFPGLSSSQLKLIARRHGIKVTGEVRALRRKMKHRERLDL